MDTSHSSENYKEQGRARIGFPSEFDAERLYQTAYHHHIISFGGVAEDVALPRSLYEFLVNRCTMEVKFAAKRIEGMTYGFSRRPGNRVVHVPTGEVETKWELSLPYDLLQEFWTFLQEVLTNPEKGKVVKRVP